MVGQNIKQKDLSHLDRNLDSLVQELATRAHRIFFEAANATARSAVLRSKVNVNPDYFAENTTLLRAVESNASELIRERTVLEPGQVKLKHLSPCHIAKRRCRVPDTRSSCCYNCPVLQIAHTVGPPYILI